MTTTASPAPVVAGACDAADLAGIGIAALCVAHCLLLPFASVLLPVVAIGEAAGERLEIALVLAGLLLGALAILPRAWRHRDPRPAAPFAVGAALLLLALAALPEGPPAEGATVAGALLLAVAHLRNRAARR